MKCYPGRDEKGTNELLFDRILVMLSPVGVSCIPEGFFNGGLTTAAKGS